MSELKSEFKLISSLEKVFCEFPNHVPEKLEGSMMKNEIYSFQMAAKITGEWYSRLNFRIEIGSELQDVITMYEVGLVPVIRPVLPFTEDEDYLSKEPGLYPDTMNKIRDNQVMLTVDRTKAIWFVVEPKGGFSGTYPIRIKIWNEREELVTELVHTLSVLDMELPKQKLMSTCWFHGDCIAALHNVEIGSTDYQNILEKYLEIYGKLGHNMILTPIFTPPLDMDEGAERTTNQLIDVTVTDGGYQFGFERLGEWIQLCQKYGIEYFEIAHLFTQWGAGHAPKIMATVDGKYQKIFGWETDAAAPEYEAFLDCFLPQLKTYLKEFGIYDKCLFHTSDEPNEMHTEQYRIARNMVAKHIEEDKMLDAISEYEFYEKGLIKRPVACNDHIAPFLENQAQHLWTYYCCMQCTDVANRFMAMPAYRNRILGYQLYKYKIEGFLQWGFNFWFSLRSRYVINPYLVTDAAEEFPSGDSFVVYPLDKEGEVVTSTRLYVFNETMQDLRALELLESLTDRETVEALLEEVVGFDTYPRTAEYILNLREAINQAILERR